ncbi:hypothetical protein EYV94_26395 [Puteibacter caeruleilacunae]|nr:hypothetical protein EYV94_26395 [Puteibacter caeruleilacunae]
MKTILIFSSIAMILLLSSCGFSFSFKNNIELKQRTIQGKEYTFSNHAKCQNFKLFFKKSNTIENHIMFYGAGKAIDKTISDNEFKEKCNLNTNDIVLVDSVSFSINDQQSKIDLFYYMTVNKFQKKTEILTLIKDKQNWELK